MSKAAQYDDAKSILVLVSQTSLHREQVQNQKRALSLLDAKHIPYQTLDGSDPKYKEERDTLFELSGIRGKYPQFFLIDERKQELTFLGDWEAIEGVNDATSLPREILNANPSIVTWEDVLG